MDHEQGLVADDLWEAIALLLPRERSKLRNGRPRCDDRLALVGIIFVLRSGIPWEMLPREFGCSGMTCWRKLRHWQTAGVWIRLHRVLIERLSDAGHLDWSRAFLDSAAVAAKKGAPRLARTRRIVGQTGHKAPSCGRPARHPARGAPEPGKPARQLDAGPHPRHRARAPRLWPPSQAARQASRRQGLRSSPLPERMPEAQGLAPHRPARHRQQLKAGPTPMGGRASAGMAQPLAPPHYPLRAAPRHPRGIRDPRLRPHLPQPDQKVLLSVLIV